MTILIKAGFEDKSCPGGGRKHLFKREVRSHEKVTETGARGRDGAIIFKEQQTAACAVGTRKLLGRVHLKAQLLVAYRRSTLQRWLLVPARIQATEVCHDRFPGLPKIWASTRQLLSSGEAGREDGRALTP